MEEFYQGYRLLDTDLITSFWAYPVYYPSIYGNFYSPYWVRYGLGYIDDHGHYHEFGSRYRIPIELETGYYRPNFIIGDTWATGTYEVRWKYRVYQNSDIEYRSVQFKVLSSGIHDQPGDYPDYLDLPASMQVIP